MQLFSVDCWTAACVVVKQFVVKLVKPLALFLSSTTALDQKGLNQISSHVEFSQRHVGPDLLQGILSLLLVFLVGFQVFPARRFTLKQPMITKL